MKKLLSITLFSVILSGCVYSSNYESGARIDETKVQEIVKGKTSEQQIVQWFGEPQFKTVLNDKDTKYVYTHTESSASAQAFTMNTTLSSKQTTLDVLVRDGVVLNFALQKSDMAPKMTHNTKL